MSHLLIRSTLLVFGVASTAALKLSDTSVPRVGRMRRKKAGRSFRLKKEADISGSQSAVFNSFVQLSRTKLEKAAAGLKVLEDAALPEGQRRVVFIRHGESIWNQAEHKFFMEDPKTLGIGLARAAAGAVVGAVKRQSTSKAKEGLADGLKAKFADAALSHKGATEPAKIMRPVLKSLTNDGWFPSFSEWEEKVAIFTSPLTRTIETLLLSVHPDDWNLICPRETCKDKLIQILLDMRERRNSLKSVDTLGKLVGKENIVKGVFEHLRKIPVDHAGNVSKIPTHFSKLRVETFDAPVCTIKTPEPGRISVPTTIDISLPDWWMEGVVDLDFKQYHNKVGNLSGAEYFKSRLLGTMAAFVRSGKKYILASGHSLHTQEFLKMYIDASTKNIPLEFEDKSGNVRTFAGVTIQEAGFRKLLNGNGVLVDFDFEGEAPSVKRVRLVGGSMLYKMEYVEGSKKRVLKVSSHGESTLNGEYLSTGAESMFAEEEGEGEEVSLPAPASGSSRKRLFQRRSSAGTQGDIEPEGGPKKSRTSFNLKPFRRRKIGAQTAPDPGEAVEERKFLWEPTDSREGAVEDV